MNTIDELKQSITENNLSLRDIVSVDLILRYYYEFAPYELIENQDNITLTEEYTYNEYKTFIELLENISSYKGSGEFTLYGTITFETGRKSNDKSLVKLDINDSWKLK